LIGLPLTGCRQVTKVAVTLQIEVTEHKNPVSLIGIFLNKTYLCPAMFEDHPLLSDREATRACATDPQHFKGLNPTGKDVDVISRSVARSINAANAVRSAPSD